MPERDKKYSRKGDERQNKQNGSKLPTTSPEGPPAGAPKGPKGWKSNANTTTTPNDHEGVTPLPNGLPSGSPSSRVFDQSHRVQVHLSNNYNIVVAGRPSIPGNITPGEVIRDFTIEDATCPIAWGRTYGSVVRHMNLSRTGLNSMLYAVKTTTAPYARGGHADDWETAKPMCHEFDVLCDIAEATERRHPWIRDHTSRDGSSRAGLMVPAPLPPLYCKWRPSPRDAPHSRSHEMTVSFVMDRVPAVMADIGTTLLDLLWPAPPATRPKPFPRRVMQLRNTTNKHANNGRRGFRTKKPAKQEKKKDVRPPFTPRISNHCTLPCPPSINNSPYHSPSHTSFPPRPHHQSQLQEDGGPNPHLLIKPCLSATFDMPRPSPPPRPDPAERYLSTPLATVSIGLPQIDKLVCGDTGDGASGGGSGSGSGSEKEKGKWEREGRGKGKGGGKDKGKDEIAPTLLVIIENMATGLALLHWGVGVDGHGVEFVMGSVLEFGDVGDCYRRCQAWMLDFDRCAWLSSSSTPSKSSDDRKGEEKKKQLPWLSSSSSSLDLGERPQTLWWLDADNYHNSGAGVKRALAKCAGAYLSNLPHLPRPRTLRLTDEERLANMENLTDEEKELKMKLYPVTETNPIWTAFTELYMSASRRIMGDVLQSQGWEPSSDVDLLLELPELFLTEVEMEFYRRTMMKDGKSKDWVGN